MKYETIQLLTQSEIDLYQAMAIAKDSLPNLSLSSFSIFHLNDFQPVLLHDATHCYIRLELRVWHKAE